MRSDWKENAEIALKERKCLFCGTTGNLEETFILKEQWKTFICTSCLSERAKLLRQIRKFYKKGRYRRLHAFFNEIPQRQEQVVLNFADFTEIMCGALPKTALKDRTWWANTESPQGSSWLAAGWKLENIYMNAEIVVFRRKAENPLKSIPKYMKALLDGGAHVMSPSIHVLTGWIRFSRKIGWYFEGKVLYERGGLSLDSLSETERAEVDEDYNVCKREIMRYKNEKSI
jgi:hypothetical protein